jgi:predicted dehydrogenase
MSQPAACLIGTGFIGPVHAEALRRLGIRLVGVLGSTPEKSAAAAKRLHIPRGYANLDDLLADTEAQVVHVASPNRHHFEQCRRALAAGKHVVCEKPLAMNSRESVELVALADRSRSVAAVCYNIRFYPLCLEARARIEQGWLGDIYHVTGSYEQDWLLGESDFNWRVLAEEGGALRAVADIGTHWLDLVQFVTGQKVTEVCADLATLLPVRRRPRGSVETFQNKSNQPRETESVRIDTEDYGSVLCRLEGGGRGCFTVSQVTAGRKNCLRFEVAGSKGALAWDSERPNELWLGWRDKPNELLIRDPALLQPSVRPHADFPGGHNEGFPDTFKHLFRAVYDYINKGDRQAPRNFPTFTDGHREIVLCEAILRSHRQHCWQTVA